MANNKITVIQFIEGRIIDSVVKSAIKLMYRKNNDKKSLLDWDRELVKKRFYDSHIITKSSPSKQKDSEEK